MAPGTPATYRKTSRETVSCVLIASLALSTAGVARAGMIPTDQVVNSTPQMCADPVPAFSRRSDVEYQLRSLGVKQTSAKARVAALTDEEVQAVVGKLESLYAGGQYVPPAVVGAGAAGGGYSGAGGAYGAAGGVVPIVAIGLFAVLNWGPAQTNGRNPYSMTSNPVPMDPNRKISEQDCTKPIVYDGRNLRCKLVGIPGSGEMEFAANPSLFRGVCADA